jgi:hypothetical protein
MSKRIVDLTGSMMYERSEAFMQKETLDLSGLKPGIYLLTARQDKNTVCKNLILNN